MKPGARHRWLAYAGAGLLTLAAMAWVDRGRDEGAVALPTARVATPVASRAAPAAGVPLLRARAENEPLDDPFGAFGEPVAAAAFAPPPREPQPAAPPAPPPLPFAYVGRWTEQGRTTIYLQRKDRSVAVLGLGRLDDEYSVQSISDQGMVFKYKALDVLQGLRFDAPAAVVTAAAAQAAPAVAGRPAPPPGAAPTPAQTPSPPSGDGIDPQPDN